MHISRTLRRMIMSQNIVLGSYVYILGLMLGGNVPEYITGVLCIYPGPYVRWEGPIV